MFHVVYIDGDMQYVILGHFETLLCLLQVAKSKFLKNLQNTSIAFELLPVHQIIAYFVGFISMVACNMQYGQFFDLLTLATSGANKIFEKF